MNTAFSDYFSEDSLIGKIGSVAGAAGCKAIRIALLLYCVLKEADDVPVWARAAIIGALGYFICPVDAVPDILPFVGFLDDIAVMSAVLATLEDLVSPFVSAQAESMMPLSCY